LTNSCQYGTIVPYWNDRSVLTKICQTGVSNMNKKSIMSGIVSVLALGLSFSVLGDVDENHGVHENNDLSEHKYQKHTFKKLKRMANAMGGFDKILSFEGMKFSSNGSRVEPEQSFKPGGEPLFVQSYNYTLINSFTDQRSRTEWLHDSDFPLTTTRHFTEVINGRQGAVFGFDTVIAPPQAPMLSTRLGARVKQNLLSSPLALIHRASRYADKIRYSGIVKFKQRPHHVVTIPGWDQPIRLFIDVKSMLPVKADTLEDDSVYGDTRWEVFYSNWVEVGDIKLPSQLIHKINGREINRETRDAFYLSEKLNAESFFIPAELQAGFNADQFAWGIRSSQWFNRTVAFGIPFDLDQRTAAALNIVEVAPKVFHARALTHNSMIIEMDDYLIVAEAPLYDERAQVLLAAIETRWPDKSVKYLLSTHFHNDHIGGVRGFANTGATLIVGEGTKEHYQTLFDASHTVFPDTFARHPHEMEIKTVEAGEDLLITDGKRRVRIFDVTNRHSTGMLLAFVEDANLVFVSDLYNPEFFPMTVPQQFLSWSVDLLNALQHSPLDIRRIVGGHGGVSSYDEFVNQIESSL